MKYFSFELFSTFKTEKSSLLEPYKSGGGLDLICKTLFSYRINTRYTWISEMLECRNMCILDWNVILSSVLQRARSLGFPSVLTLRIYFYNALPFSLWQSTMITAEYRIYPFWEIVRARGWNEELEKKVSESQRVWGSLLELECVRE